MDNMKMDLHFFFVPNRLIWSNWQKFCGEQTDPGDSIAYTVPQVKSPASTGYAVGSLYHHLGVAPTVPNLPHNNLYGRAYNLIYNEHYRDQDLIDSVTVDTGDTTPGSTWDDPADYVLLKRAKYHDYFTSCRPYPQKGATSVDIGLATTAPVTRVSQAAGPLYMYQQNTDTYASATGLNTNASGELSNSSLQKLTIDPNGSLVTDLSTAGAVTINQLRESFQIQRILERDARAGTRYIEVVLSHFGVVSPDARLQRPEYLGGGSTDLNLNVIAQTSGTDSEPTPLGTLGAAGTFTGFNNGFVKSFTEHGVILGLASVRADLTYQQGLPREYSRQTRYDYYWPAFAHLGEQAVYKKELYVQDPSTDTGSTGTADNERVFGYQERWAEYRQKPSEIHGFFCSQAAADSLDAWHLAQEFASLPSLNQTFIEETPPMERIKAVTDTDWDIQADIYWRERHARVMPVRSVPGLIDHF
jgi:hypothetical protein